MTGWQTEQHRGQHLKLLLDLYLVLHPDERVPERIQPGATGTEVQTDDEGILSTTWRTTGGASSSSDGALGTAAPSPLEQWLSPPQLAAPGSAEPSEKEKVMSDTDASGAVETQVTAEDAHQRVFHCAETLIHFCSLIGPCDRTLFGEPPCVSCQILHVSSMIA